MYDTALARQLSAIVAIAKDKKLAPDEIASDMQNFSGFWYWEREKLEDVCKCVANVVINFVIKVYHKRRASYPEATKNDCEKFIDGDTSQVRKFSMSPDEQSH